MPGNNNPYAYRNAASLGGVNAQPTQFVYDKQGLGHVVPVQQNLAQEKMNAINGGGSGNGPRSDGKNNATANGVATNGNNPTNGSAQGAQPVLVQRANAFQNVGGKGKTIEQRRQIQEQNNVTAGNQMLNAVVADNMARREAEQTNALYETGQMATKADTPLPHQTNMSGYYRQQNAQQPAWGKDSQGKETVPNGDDGRSAYQKFRDGMYDEEKIRKESDKRAKIYAVGDALRHLGNLYYTAHDASPQKYGTAPATEERDRYEKGRANRDALAYQYYNADLNQKMKAADQERQNALAQDKMMTNQSTRDKNQAQIDKWVQESKIQLEKYPYELQKLAGEAISAKANGDIKTYEAGIKALEYQNTPTSIDLANKLKQAQINHQNASTASAWASAKYHNAQTQKTMDEIKSNGNYSFSGYYGTMVRPDKKELGDDEVSSIYSKAKSEGWISGDGYNTYIQGGVDSKHAMIASISDALNEGNPRQRQELTHYLVNERGFDIADPNRRKQFDYANGKINRQTGHKVGAGSPTPTKPVTKKTESVFTPANKRGGGRTQMSGKTGGSTTTSERGAGI